MYDSVDLHFFFHCMINAVFRFSNSSGLYQISMESRHSLYWKLQSSCLKFSTYSFIYRVVFCKNEKVRDVHSSATPCQHCPHHLPFFSVQPLRVFATNGAGANSYRRDFFSFSFQTDDPESPRGLSSDFLCYICGINSHATAMTCSPMPAAGLSATVGKVRENDSGETVQCPTGIQYL